MGEKETLEALRNFVGERDWSQFHSNENLAKSIVIEAAELLENFQWNPNCDAEKVSMELADVLTYCYLLAANLGIAPSDLVMKKLSISRQKYPVEASKGRSEKYDRL